MKCNGFNYVMQRTHKNKISEYVITHNDNTIFIVVLYTLYAFRKSLSRPVEIFNALNEVPRYGVFSHCIGFNTFHSKNVYIRIVFGNEFLKNKIH